MCEARSREVAALVDAAAGRSSAPRTFGRNRGEGMGAVAPLSGGHRAVARRPRMAKVAILEGFHRRFLMGNLVDLGCSTSSTAR